MPSSRPHLWPALELAFRSTRKALVCSSFLALPALVLSGCGGAAGVEQDLTPAGSTLMTFGSVGASVQPYTIPAGTSSLTIVARGGQGGLPRDSLSDRSSAAQVTGTVAVQPGQVLLVSVGGEGSDAGTSKHDPLGGWGGLSASGGNGNAASNYLRTSGAGGGATTVQLADADQNNPKTLLIAAGGGGAGAGSGDPLHGGNGGGAGCNTDKVTPWWPGADGQNGSSSILKGGNGGSAGGELGMAGGRGGGGSDSGGNGGGGGGGLRGGNPGTGASGTSAGAGGGSGSSTTYSMTDTSVACVNSGDGAVTISS